MGEQALRAAAHESVEAHGEHQPVGVEVQLIAGGPEGDERSG